MSSQHTAGQGQELNITLFDALEPIDPPCGRRYHRGGKPMTDNNITEPRYSVPRLDLDGEPIKWLKDFEALIAAGAIPTETILGLKHKPGDGATSVTVDPTILDNMARAVRGFRAVQAYAVVYGEIDVATLINDLVVDLHHLLDAYGGSWEEVLTSAGAIYTDETVEEA